jgi:hypothetical protein
MNKKNMISKKIVPLSSISFEIIIESESGLGSSYPTLSSKFNSYNQG